MENKLLNARTEIESEENTPVCFDEFWPEFYEKGTISRYLFYKTKRMRAFGALTGALSVECSKQNAVLR